MSIFLFRAATISQQYKITKRKIDFAMNQIHDIENNTKWLLIRTE